MLAVRTAELAKAGRAPAVDGYLKCGPRHQARNEASHDGNAHSAMDVDEFDVGHDMTGDPELLDRYFRVSAGGE